MKSGSIRRYLKPHSIYNERKTTINGAFAAAVAPWESYDALRVSDALDVLGQNPEEDLLCVYCGLPAQTWDHLVGVVKNGLPAGGGHQLGNLVPCCKDCNSSKGNRDWRVFVEGRILDEESRKTALDRIANYHQQFTRDLPAPYQADPTRWSDYLAIRNQILDLMQEADRIAKELREG